MCCLKNKEIWISNIQLCKHIHKNVIYMLQEYVFRSNTLNILLLYYTYRCIAFHKAHYKLFYKMKIPSKRLIHTSFQLQALYLCLNTVFPWSGSILLFVIVLQQWVWHEQQTQPSKCSQVAMGKPMQGFREKKIKGDSRTVESIWHSGGKCID